MKMSRVSSAILGWNHPGFQDVLNCDQMFPTVAWMATRVCNYFQLLWQHYNMKSVMRSLKLRIRCNFFWSQSRESCIGKRTWEIAVWLLSLTWSNETAEFYLINCYLLLTRPFMFSCFLRCKIWPSYFLHLFCLVISKQFCLKGKK